MLFHHSGETPRDLLGALEAPGQCTLCAGGDALAAEVAATATEIDDRITARPCVQ